ncbi:MAG: phosphate ABC transporter permease [Aequorivita sp.]
MKNLSLLLILIFSFNLIVAQEELIRNVKDNSTDNWSGRYRLEIRNGDTYEDEPLIFVNIRKAQDINPEEVTPKYSSDLERWIISTEGTDDEEIMHRFLYNLEEGENEYEQFGWTDLYKDGKMECIDAGHFFICKTTPNTTVNFGDDEAAFTESGIFGIRLNLGLFKLYEVGE